MQDFNQRAIRLNWSSSATTVWAFRPANFLCRSGLKWNIRTSHELLQNMFFKFCDNILFLFWIASKKLWIFPFKPSPSPYWMKSPLGAIVARSDKRRNASNNGRVNSNQSEKSSLLLGGIKFSLLLVTWWEGEGGEGDLTENTQNYQVTTRSRVCDSTLFSETNSTGECCLWRWYFSSFSNETCQIWRLATLSCWNTNHIWHVSLGKLGKILNTRKI